MGMTSLKLTPNWDGLGCGGMNGGRGAAQSADSRSGDLVIARDPVIGKAGTPDGALG